MSALPLLSTAEAADVGPVAWIEPYNVVWMSQSRNSVDSMPLGGGVFGLNVWVEDNELFFYIGSPDAHVENGFLVKLGRVRIATKPAIFLRDFRQELDLADGCIRFQGRTAAERSHADAFGWMFTGR